MVDNGPVHATSAKLQILCVSRSQNTRKGEGVWMRHMLHIDMRGRTRLYGIRVCNGKVMVLRLSLISGLNE